MYVQFHHKLVASCTLAMESPDLHVVPTVSQCDTTDHRVRWWLRLMTQRVDRSAYEATNWTTPQRGLLPQSLHSH